MNTVKQIANYANAGYPALYIQTHEDQRIEGDVISAASAVKGEPFSIYSWTCTSGLIHHRSGKDSEVIGGTEDIFSALDKYYAADFKADRSFIILHGLHLFIADPNPVLFQKLKDCCLVAKATNRMMIIIAPVVKIPVELEKLVTVIEYKLPNREELFELAKSVCAAVDHKINKANVDAIMDAASGLTTHEAENAFALSLIESQDLTPSIIAREKASTIKKNGLLEIVDCDIGLEEVGGSDEAKSWLTKRRNAFSKEARKYGLPMPKGFLQVGIPGCLHGDTAIYDPVDKTSLTVKQRYENGVQFSVISKTDKGELVVGKAFPPRKYNPEAMLKFTFENGQSITVTGGHLFWCSDKWITASELRDRFLASSAVHLPTISAFSLPESREDDDYSTRTIRGFLADYSKDFHLCDEQPREVEGICQSSPPSQADGAQHSQPFHLQHTQQTGDLQLACKDNLSCVSHRPSKQDFDGHHDHTSRRFYEEKRTPSPEMSQASLKSPSEKVLDCTIPEPASAFQESSESICFSSTTRYQYFRVTSIENVGTHTYYDFHVKDVNNYWACGVFHHNCGKTLLAKATAKILGVPLLKLDGGKLFGSLIGQSESNIRSVCATAEAIAPCVLLIDEIEKGFSGSKSSGSTDGGTAARVLGSFLQWMNDKTAPVFVVATANDVSQLPPEFLRKGRFDEMFFVDLPDHDERKQIWQIQIRRNGRKAEGFDLEQLADATDRWTGAEIEALFKEALFAAFDEGKEPTTKLLLSLSEQVVPLSKMMSAQIDGMRDWAKGRTRSASTRKTADVQTVGRRLA
jgi:AAA+ superfamily predicted ATPase